MTVWLTTFVWSLSHLSLFSHTTKTGPDIASFFWLQHRPLSPRLRLICKPHSSIDKPRQSTQRIWQGQIWRRLIMEHLRMFSKTWWHFDWTHLCRADYLRLTASVDPKFHFILQRETFMGQVLTVCGNCIEECLQWFFTTTTLSKATKCNNTATIKLWMAREVP